MGDPLWYKEAIIYELHVKCFYDSSGDGIGDFKGLTEKLDYLQDLGVTAIWLLPFYPSPLKDDGYDIANYMDVNHQYGTLADFKRLLKEAHKRGLKVITELVINHTSDQHPWFQRARNAPAGSRYRDYYVWNDSPDLYPEVRIIFQDFESSNWTWDPVAKSYFWHRFYSHQPDLNFENPEVHRELYRALDFWLKMGVDGVRLDAIPYLYEEEGTICENLPQTHGFLKKLRAYVDENYEDRMLLAEANQWPEDAAKYFGDGDECHMAFHFPVMPRLFMSIHLEDSLPIIEIMGQTPEIPSNAQWALFLRNHDELTLEMVTDEERDYMFRVYAHDPQARLNLGIRRRLAPLLKNDRRKIELMNALLFSLIGTPVLYYGDELGMGDNIYLGDRNGVRTPMQWSNDRNAGFSRTNPQRLYLPPIIDSEYHYETVNVEAQSSNPYSLLWWTKQLISLRKRFQAFGSGTTSFLLAENRKVLIFFREYKNELILIVANLSRFAQYVEMDLSKYSGYFLIELFSGGRFPRIGELPYFLTLGPYGYYWFALEKEPEESVLHQVARAKEREVAVLTLEKDLFHPQMRRTLEGALKKYLFKREWFHSLVVNVDKTKVFLVDHLLLPQGIHLVIQSVTFTSGITHYYPLFLKLIRHADDLIENHPELVVAKIKGDGVIYDVSATSECSKLLVEIIKSSKRVKGDRGNLKGVYLGEQSTVSAGSEGHMICRDEGSLLIPLEEGALKIFTVLDEGMSLDVEMRLFLAKETNFSDFLPLIGYLEYSGEISVAIAEQIPITSKRFNAQELAIEGTERFLMHMETIGSEITQEELLPESGWLERARGELPVEMHHILDEFLERARHLGKTTGEFHLAMASQGTNMTFAPVVFTRFYQRSLYQTTRRKLSEAFGYLKLFTNPNITTLKKHEKLILEQLSVLASHKFSADRLRYHGNFTLEHLFHTGKEFLITDFEGNLDYPYSERRYKRSPLLDVASMFLSLMECGFISLNRLQSRGLLTDIDPEISHMWVESWATWSGVSFLRAYLRTIEIGEGSFLPEDEKELEYLLHVFLMEKCLEKIVLEGKTGKGAIDAPVTLLLHCLSRYDSF